MKKLNRSDSFIIGSLLFGMLFGAGNIIFPTGEGQLAAGNYLYASLGFLVTAVGLPILAIISFSLSQKSSLFEYTLPAGKTLAYIFTLGLLLTIGPLFATPRTATVAFEIAIKPLVKGEGKLPLLIYSFLFFTLVLFFALRPSKIMDTIGKYMAPAFIVLISILMFANILNPMGSPKDFLPQVPYDTRPFIQGILDGYSTMDVLACLAFGIIIVENIKRLGVKEGPAIAKQTGRSSIITLFLMSILYITFCHFGASSLGSLGPQKNGGLVIALASLHYFKSFGHILLALTTSLACLKTAIGLAVSISESLHRIFPNFLSSKTWTYIFVLISFVIANFGLDRILQISLPVLMFLYPLAISFILLWFSKHFFGLKDRAFQITILVACLPAILDLLMASSDQVKNIGFVSSLLQLAKSYLPFFEIGLGWLVPVLFTLVLCFIFLRERREVY